MQCTVVLVNIFKFIEFKYLIHMSVVNKKWYNLIKKITHEKTFKHASKLLGKKKITEKTKKLSVCKFGINPHVFLVLNLTWLKIDKCGLTKLPLIHKLKYLSAAHNQLTSVELANTLNHVDLSFNKLTNILLPEGIQDVNLRCNKISDFSCFPTSIVYLDVSFNKGKLTDLLHLSYTKTITIIGYNALPKNFCILDAEIITNLDIKAYECCSKFFKYKKIYITSASDFFYSDYNFIDYIDYTNDFKKNMQIDGFKSFLKKRYNASAKSTTIVDSSSIY